MIYCERCGLANREGSRYCNGCGRALAAGTPAEEPLPSWLREAAVAGYLWKGDLLLPEWLAAVKPFRELYGAGAVVLPPPYAPVEESPEAPAEGAAPVSEEISFLDPDEEDGPVEGDLLILDDLDAPFADEGAAPPGAGQDLDDRPHMSAEDEARTPDTTQPPADPAGASGGDAADSGELIVEVVAEVLADTEPEPVLDESGRPAPVLETERPPDEEMVAAVFIDPEDEALLEGASEVEDADPMAEAVAAFGPASGYVEPAGESGSEGAGTESPGDMGFPDARTGDQPREEAPSGEDPSAGTPGALPAFQPAPSEPSTAAPLSEAARRFRSASERVLDPGAAGGEHGSGDAGGRKG